MRTTFNTWLPGFDGFYNTIAEPSSDSIDFEYTGMLIDLSENYAFPEDLLMKLEDDLCVFDNEKYEDRYSRLITMEVERVLNQCFPLLKVEIKFQELIRPKEYNFANDHINCAIEADWEEVVKYLKRADIRVEFARYLNKNYVSCDGFLSHYSSNIEDWLDVDKWGKHQAGSVLNFLLCLMEPDIGEILYNRVMEITNVEEYCSLIPEAVTLVECPRGRKIAHEYDRQQHAFEEYFSKKAAGIEALKTREKFIGTLSNELRDLLRELKEDSVGA